MESFPFKIKLKFNEEEDNIIQPPNSYFNLNEIIKKKLNLENYFLYYNPENKGKIRIQNENDYFQFIDFCNNYLNKYDLKDYEFDLVISNEEILSENEEGEENEDDKNLNEENEDVNKKEKHNKGFKEQKRIYYIKEKKDMQREEQEREEKEKEEEEKKKNENENQKSKKKKKK